MSTLRELPASAAVDNGTFLRLAQYSFKLAASPHELEQVHRLNYRTFVREIHQHADPGTEYLIDKYHHKNRYFVALRGQHVVGMLAVHDQPPFSVAERLSDPDVLERLGARLLEVRLLAIEPGERHSLVFAGLMWSLYQYARRAGYTHVVGSGVADRQSLYERLGFRTLGPAVPSGEATFVPMALALDELPEQIRRDIELWKRRIGEQASRGGDGQPICLMPGPVEVASDVREAFTRRPISHRSRQFAEEFEQVRRVLSELVGGLDVALFVGSGTLANDAVAATLAARRQPTPGLMLANGEFGERLVRQARRAGLQFQLLQWPWGQPWDLGQVAAALDDDRIDWIWGVHLESSTGVLNDLPGAVALARDRRIRVYADCVSSVGAVPLDLCGVDLATGVSGKALGAYAGLAMVFCSPRALEDVDSDRLPTYLDVRATLAASGPRFTFLSPELRAIHRALEFYATPAGRRARYAQYAELGRYVRERLRLLAIQPLAAESCSAPTITTFVTPDRRSSEEFVARCLEWGFEVAGLSEYLSERRWAQIATMGCVTQEHCAELFGRLSDWLAGRPAPRRVGVTSRMSRSLRQSASSA
jgi:aspartate aminotransferase-like enzyme/N-acyl-L-homoserine lactone synthetase